MSFASEAYAWLIKWTWLAQMMEELSLSKQRFTKYMQSQDQEALHSIGVTGMLITGSLTGHLIS